MLAEQGIYAALSTVPGCKFYPVQLPDADGTIPPVFGIYSKIGGQSFNSLDGDLNVSRARMQVSIYATTYNTLKTIEQAVNTAMQTANQAKLLVNVSSTVPTDGFEPETRRFYVHMDFYVWVYGE